MSLIPCIIPPLHGLRVLVTRPLEQAERLAELIAARGGEPRVFASMVIEPVAPIVPVARSLYDWILFLSANAVRHAAALVQPALARKVVAIGQATARALAAASWTVDLVPPKPHTSEALLAMPEFTVAAGENVLLVRGEGGRGVLEQALIERGACVESLVVYRRVPTTYSREQLEALEREWREAPFDIVTATSAETLDFLYRQLSESARELLCRTPLLVASPRIAGHARTLGHTGECVVAPAADDASLIATLARWFARAR